MTLQTSEILCWIFSSSSAGPYSNSGRLRKNAVADDLECASKSSKSANRVVGASGFEDFTSNVLFFWFGRVLGAYAPTESGSSYQIILSIASVPAESFSTAAMALA